MQRTLALTVLLTGIVILPLAQPARGQSCANPIACENQFPGSTGWQISGSGASDIQGFATDISVNAGQTVFFKIKTTAANYHLDIYRLGYYGGAGARKITTVNPSVALPQTQPACLTDTTTNLIDCGNWTVSASWNVPTNSTSGIYFANLIRADNGDVSQLFWVVRNDASHSDILFQTSDETWTAYNDYGGHSLYGGAGTWDLNNRAFKVSYNRPSDTRTFEAVTFLFNAEYPMVKWLEANGYDVSYFTGVDAVRNAALITNHKLYLTAGHDEYVSKERRANVQAARDAGVNLAFFSGNEFFWKTRWENSIDGSNTPYRTMVCYKETYYGTSTLYKADPLDPPTWTGTWADSRFSPPADGGQPQNALTGTLFAVNGPGPDNSNLSMQVTAADGKMRFWRNTSVTTLSAGQTATLPAGTLGYEWDTDIDNGFRPAGAIPLSTSTYTMTQDLLLDYGATYGAGSVTHHLVLYRAPSSALVFGAGTVQWAWGLDSDHDGDVSNTADIRMQQATMNLLADMGVQPTTMQTGLVPATKSTDTTAPAAVITSPGAGASVPYGTPVAVTGTASDGGGGVVGAVEVSVDGGQTWHPATGRAQWSYSWSPWTLSGSATVLARAIDDSGNIQNPPAAVSFNITGEPICPCSIWTNSTVPGTPTTTDTSSVELGTKFRSDVGGYVTGVRFYKGTGNTGTHVGNLWTAQGSRLASVTFTNETTSGWQQANFASPVLISANTTYIVSYYAPNGGYADDASYFTGPTDKAPLHAPADNTISGNGVYVYATGGGFPASTYNSANYWVDLVFVPSTPWNISGTVSGAGGATVTLSGHTNATVVTDSSGNYSFSGVQNGPYTVTPSAAGYNFTPASQSVTVNGSSTSGVNFTATALPTYMLSGTATGGAGATVALSGAATASTTADSSGNYSFIVPNGTYTVTPSRSGYIFSPATRTVTISSANITGVNFTASQASSIWSSSAVPGVASTNDPSAVEIGLKFRSDVAGSVIGVRFYKGSANGGTHIGHLWTSGGSLLGTVTFANETASGWQQANFASPVSISANTVYVISYYAPNGGYADDGNFFATSGVDNAPLHALANTVSQDGIYLYGLGGGFPTNSYNATNYWVDLVFSPSATYSISGTITGGAASTVALTGAATASATADSSGNYSFTGVLSGSYTVTPGKAGLVFSPANAPVTVNAANVTGVNFTANTAPTYSISGAITGGAGATVALSGAATASTTADSSGSYSFTGLANGSYTVTPNKAGYTLTPANATLTVNAANITGVNFTASTAPTYGISGAITGGAGATVALSGAATASATADSSGSYSFTGLANGSYTVTPSKAGYTLTPANAPVTVNGANATGVNFTASQASSIWSSSAVPGVASTNDPSAVEIGLKFRSDVAGSVIGVRFYKGSANGGTHIGHLWTSGGSLLGTVTFANETASGWQQANFTSPVSISANTVYVISYYAPNGGYADDANFFATSGVDNPPLHALANTVSPDGVYLYGSGGGFPSNTFSATNYWVDVAFFPAATYSISGTITGGAGSNVALTGATTASTTADFSGNYSFTGAPNGSYTVTPGKAGLVFSPASASVTVNGANATGVNFTTSTVPTYSIAGTITGGAGVTVALSGAATASATADSSGNYTFTGVANGSYTVTPGKTGYTFSPANAVVTVNGANASGVNFTATQASSIWSSSAVPAVPSANDSSAVELGLKFQSDVAGSVIAVRFYKGSANTGTHIGHLWTSGGSLLGTVTFANETASGWQQANFTSPVSISANTVYVISYYAPNGGYAADGNFFATSGVDNAPLHALANTVSPDGVYLYGSGGGFPRNTFSATNYWVDLVFAQ